MIKKGLYNIPNNWCWSRLGKITSVIGGGTPSSKISEYYDNGDIAWITPSDLSNYNNMYISNGKKMITKLGLMKSSAKLLPKGTVCLSSRAPIGYVVIAKNELSTNQGFKSFLPSKAFKSEYLYWYLKSIKHILEAKASGTTFLELSAKKAGEVEIPLPPINEQQRIVNRIESLFVKLNRAKELIENTLAQFEQNKMAILHKAFIGELTAKWRKENNINNIKDVSYIEKLPYIVPNGWYWDKLENITIRIVDGDHNPPAKEKEKTNYIMLSAQNIGYSGFINMDKVRYLSKDNFDKCHKRTCLEDEDILFSSVGSIGNAMVYREKENDKITFQRSVTIIKTKINPYYLRYVLLSPYCQQIFKTESIGTAKKGFYIKQMKNLIVPVPTIEEQQEIVNILDKLLVKYSKIKDLEKQLEQIELLKKAILAKAFRGELGTNNPDEESAENLLKEILAEK